MAESIYPHVILGLWPMAGVTSTGVSLESNRVTMRAAIDQGARWFDSAYSYGLDGESDRLLGEFPSTSARALHVIGKVGQRYEGSQRVVDGSPDSLARDAETSLNRMRRDKFDLLMLHGVDPNVEIEESAKAVVELQSRGMADAVGVCNVSLEELRRFADIVVPAAVQLPLNLFQRSILTEITPWCEEHGVAVHVYWTLMKGILAGKIGREHQFDDRDSRPGYDIYQGQKREAVHRVLDNMVPLAQELAVSISELSIGWALAQPGITSALVGAKYDWQIAETIRARPCPPEVVSKIDSWAEATGFRDF